MEKSILHFIENLEKNNNREWFQKNKALYDEAREAFEATINVLIPAIARFDSSVKFVTAKDCLFRIYRDVRFAKDKSPYKTNFGAWISKSGRKSSGPGYYVHMQPDGCFLSGGIYMPDAETLKKIRQEIFYNVAELKRILADRKFKKYFSGIDEWDKQKIAPRDYPKDFPEIEILKNRSYTISHAIERKVVESDAFPEYALKVFQTMYPYNVFLGRAIDL
jgi:uncharacterized protein (TIGR02453 family)